MCVFNLNMFTACYDRRFEYEPESHNIMLSVHNTIKITHHAKNHKKFNLNEKTQSRVANIEIIQRLELFDNSFKQL